MPAGRPSKYNDEIVKEAYEYIEIYETLGDAIPSHAGMCHYINIGKSTLYDWAQDEEKVFSDILEKCNIAQERVLLSKGLTGDFNAAITKLALGKQGYKESTATEVSGPDGGPIQTDSVIEFVPVGNGSAD